MSLGAIPWSSIILWANYSGLTDTDDIDRLIRHIRALEGAQSKFDKEREDKK